MVFTLKRVDLHRKTADWYSEYLQSEKWITFRTTLVAKRGPLCEICKEQPHFSLHHKTYARLFNELPEDVLLVCKDCHEFCHRTHNIPLLSWIYETNLSLILEKLKRTKLAPIILKPTNR